MDYGSLLPKLFELQKLNSRKTELAVRVASIDAWERTRQLELDLRRVIHSIGGVRARFNETGMINSMSEQRRRDEEVKKEYRKLCEQIKTLEDEIDSQIIIANL